MNRAELYDVLIFWNTVVAVCNLSLLTMAYWVGVRTVHELTSRALHRLVQQARDAANESEVSDG